MELVYIASFSSYHLITDMLPKNAPMLLLFSSLTVAAIARNVLGSKGLIVLVAMQVLAMPAIGYDAFQGTVGRTVFVSFLSALLYVLTLCWLCVSIPYSLTKAGALDRTRSWRSAVPAGIAYLLLSFVGNAFYVWSFTTAAWAALYSSARATIASEISMMVVSFALLILLPAVAGLVISWRDTFFMRKTILAAAIVPWLVAAPGLLTDLAGLYRMWIGWSAIELASGDVR